MSVDARRLEWTTATLGSLGTFLRGRGGTKADVAAAGVPCIRYGDLYTQHNDIIRGIESFIAPERATAYTSLQVGDVVFAGSGETHEEIGKAAAFLGPDPAVVGADTIIFRPGSRLHPAYLGYAANATRAARYKARLGQGSSVIHIGTVQLKELSLDLPPLPEQRRIAEILDTLDEAIRKTEQVIAKLQQMKQGLLHDLLTRGIDEHGELRDPERHPEQFQDSPLGRIPREWQITQLGDLLKLIRNGTTATQVSEPTPHPVCRIETISHGVIDWRRVRYLLRPEPAYLMEPGDILYSHINSVAHMGKVAIHSRDKPLYHGMNLMLLRIDDRLAIPRFVHAALTADRARAYARRECKSAINQASLGQRQIGALPLLTPPIAEQREITSRIGSLHVAVEEEEVTLDKLRSLQHGLMDDLLTGHVRVPVPEEPSP
jgi:type I restriction enzyme S subunit